MNLIESHFIFTKYQKYRFIQKGKINNNLMITIQLTLIVLQNGMNILDVSLPSEM